jgi:hypothetical protein
MSASPVSVASPAQTSKPASPAEAPTDDVHPTAKTTSKWQSYATPILVLLLATAVLLTVTQKWNSWEGGKVEQVTERRVRSNVMKSQADLLGVIR